MVLESKAVFKTQRTVQNSTVSWAYKNHPYQQAAEINQPVCGRSVNATPSIKE